MSYNSRWQMQNDDCFDGVVGDKGVYSTVSDMFKWDKAFYDGKLLSQEMMKEAYAPKSLSTPANATMAMGWRLLQQPDGNYLVLSQWLVAWQQHGFLSLYSGYNGHYHFI